MHQYGAGRRQILAFSTLPSRCKKRSLFEPPPHLKRYPSHRGYIMSVNFAAVHEHKPWRKHRIHQSQYAAVEGNDGAKNLLRRTGRVAGMWEKYGDVRCVFVWEDQALTGQVFRLTAKGKGSIDSAMLLVDQILQFEAKKECTTHEIAACFGAQSNPQPAFGAATAEPPSLRFVHENLNLFPDELPMGQTYFEGLAQATFVNRYERSSEARAASIAHHGCVCQVCRVDFTKRYGPLGEGFIHVHHIVQISSIGERYCINPIVDLVPVCPNCHAMLHRQEPPLKVEELRTLLGDD